jgi:hypothetical protein
MLVVPQLGVVLRLLLADEVVLPDERLDRRLGQDVLDRVGLGHDLPDLGGVGLAGLEIGPHPVAQRLGLADVEQLAAPILEQVDPGPIRQRPERFGEPGSIGGDVGGHVST